jgi:ATP-dependent helicase HepA
VRWLLADEVGLGKTVEACLILNHLLRRGRASRPLVVAPETLTVQWLGELWRKYHRVFVLLDDKRLEDVEKDFGADFNPFDAYDRVVISHEKLASSPRLVEQILESEIDCLIVDEAHHLKRPSGHPGNPLYRAIEPLCSPEKHVLLLTATPLEDDAHGFFRLLQLLRPEVFPDNRSFDDVLGEMLEKRQKLPACTSATRREDIGGLPPRVAQRIDLEGVATNQEATLLQSLSCLQETAPGENPALDKRLADLTRRALGSPAALLQALNQKELSTIERAWDDQGRNDGESFKTTLDQIARDDARLAWLAEQLPKWHKAGDKTLLFVADRPTLEWLKVEIERRGLPRVAVFHEDLSTRQRDIGVAQFRIADGPSLLISTESGGEGRNFEFCTRLVLFDLPWDPMVVEQRIGRLDRIGRDREVEVLYFRPEAGLRTVVAVLYNRLESFERPLGAFEKELASVENALEQLAVEVLATSNKGQRTGTLGNAQARFQTLLDDAHRAYELVTESAHHELHREPYDSAYADEILGRVPTELQGTLKDVVLRACYELGLHVEEHREGRRYSIELDPRARVDSLPFVGSEGSFLGTFDRLEAVADETIDFFASGHPLVEGLLAHMDEAKFGRTALFFLDSPDEASKGFGLLAAYKTEGGAGASGGYRLEAIDSKGNERPDWVELVDRVPFPGKVVTQPKRWLEQAAWPSLVRRIGARLESQGRPVAVAGMRVL